jgi:RsmE family RNA methyltransferase
VNLLLFTPEEYGEENRIRVSDERLEHLLHVHGACVGDTVRVGEINGKMGEATVVAISDSEATLAVELSQAPPAKLPLTLVLALPRPKMLRRILRAVAEFGVGELHLVNSYRVEKSYWQTPVLESDTIRNYLVQGLEQARDTVLPSVEIHKLFKPFVEDAFPAMLTGKKALLGHPGDYTPCPRILAQKTLLVIGPEGGFIKYEVEKLQEAGCETVSLGPRILRVENAVTALFGRFS